MYSKYESFTVASMVFCTSVYASCVQNEAGVVTGGACSINELQNLEKNRTEKRKMNFLPYGQRDLRPVRQQVQQMPKTDDDCLFGKCLYKTLINSQGR